MSNLEERRAVEQLRVTALEYAFRMRGGVVEKTLSTAAQILAFLRGEGVETFQGEEEPPARPFTTEFHRSACRALGLKHEDDLGGVRSVIAKDGAWDVAYHRDFMQPIGDIGWEAQISLMPKIGEDHNIIVTALIYAERYTPVPGASSVPGAAGRGGRGLDPVGR